MNWLFPAPDDISQRYTLHELPINSLFLPASKTRRWYIVDGNTDEPVMGMNQPNNKGKLIWRGTHDDALWYCMRLNHEQRKKTR